MLPKLGLARNLYLIAFKVKTVYWYKSLVSQEWIFYLKVKLFHMRPRLRFFLFRGKVLFRSRDIDWSFCIINHAMIYQICDVMMSISTWDRVHFWIYFLNHRSLTHQLIDINKGNKFQEFFEQFTGLGLSARSFSI